MITKNLIILKYMGFIPLKAINEWTNSEFYYYNDPDLKDYVAIPEYNRDWNKLMKVVEKINRRDWVTILADTCTIHSLKIDEFKTITIEKEGYPLIMPVFDAVLEYIKWYNDNVDISDNNVKNKDLNLHQQTNAKQCTNCGNLFFGIGELCPACDLKINN
jgi:hypothetical protein